MKKIFCFGNEFIEGDEVAFDIGSNINLYGFEVIFAQSFNDILDMNEDFVILDVAKGIDEVCLIKDIDNLSLCSSLVSCHDMDLAFYLKLMKESGKIKDVNIIAIPYGVDKKDYDIVKDKVELILEGIR